MRTDASGGQSKERLSKLALEIVLQFIAASDICIVWLKTDTHWVIFFSPLRWDLAQKLKWSKSNDNSWVFKYINILRTKRMAKETPYMGPEICFTQQDCALNCTVYTRLEPMTHSISQRMSSWEAVWLWLCPMGWSSSGSSSILSIALLSLSLSLSAPGCETVRMTLVKHPLPHCLLATLPEEVTYRHSPRELHFPESS